MTIKAVMISARPGRMTEQRDNGEIQTAPVDWQEGMPPLLAR